MRTGTDQSRYVRAMNGSQTDVSARNVDCSCRSVARWRWGGPAAVPLIFGVPHPSSRVAGSLLGPSSVFISFERVGRRKLSLRDVAMMQTASKATAGTFQGRHLMSQRATHVVRVPPHEQAAYSRWAEQLSEGARSLVAGAQQDHGALSLERFANFLREQREHQQGRCLDESARERTG